MKIVVGHKNPDTDTICSSIVMAYFMDAKPGRQGELNPETKYVLEKFGVPEPELITSAEGHEIIMVDHTEESQALDDFDKGEVITIIDHHKNGMITSKPIIHLTKPVGATATIIAELYFNNSLGFIGAKNKELTPKMAGLLLSAILSDTVLFNSPTTTEQDRVMAYKLADAAGIDDIEAFGKELLKAKSTIVKESPEKIVQYDFKEFNMNGNKIGIGQVEVVDAADLEQKEKEIVDILKRKVVDENYRMIVFAITDVLKKGSKVLVLGNSEDFEKAFNIKLENGAAFMEGVMSRKKQLVPPLEEFYKNA